MKKGIITVLGFVLTMGSYAQSFGCDANNAVKGDFGVAPMSLPFAYASYPYSTRLSLKVPRDPFKITGVQDEVTQGLDALDPVDFQGSTQGSVEIRILNYWVVNVHGLPNGFNYQCQNYQNACISYGTTDNGCIEITGTPQEGQEGFYVLNVELKAQVQRWTMLTPDCPCYGDGFPLTVSIPSILTIQSKEAKSLGVDNLSTKQVELYPNPVKDFVIINTPSAYSFYTLYDMHGQAVMTETSTTDQTIVNVADLNNGVYFIQLTDEHGVNISTPQKLIVQH